MAAAALKSGSISDSEDVHHAALKPVKPAKFMSTGAVLNFSIILFYTAEFRSQIRPIQDTLNLGAAAVHGILNLIFRFRIVSIYSLYMY